MENGRIHLPWFFIFSILYGVIYMANDGLQRFCGRQVKRKEGYKRMILDLSN
jgi:hypothetical protein